MNNEKNLIPVDLSDEALNEFKEKIKNKTLMDDRFMSAFFKDFPEGVELVLRIILEKADLKVKKLDVQLTMTNLYGRSVRLDVLAEDKDGILYNIEVQNASEGAGFKRARYYSSMLDSNVNTMIGEDFDKLPKTVVIFICENDILKGKRPLYRINRHVQETGDIFEDDAQIIYVNGSNKDSGTALGRLMQDFFEKDPDKMNNEVLAEKSRHLKFDKEGLEMVREYLTEEEWETAIKQGTQQGIEQGIEQGERSKAVSTAILFLSLGKNTKEEIAACTGLSLEEVEKLSAGDKITI